MAGTPNIEPRRLVEAAVTELRKRAGEMDTGTRLDAIGHIRNRRPSSPDALADQLRAAGVPDDVAASVAADAAAELGFGGDTTGGGGGSGGGGPPTADIGALRERLREAEGGGEAADFNVADLENGDIIFNEEEGREEIIIRPSPEFNPCIAPTGPGGPIKALERCPDPGEIQKQIDDGILTPVDLAINRNLAPDRLPVPPDEDVFIRFGDIPEGERSVNSIDNSKEEGVSVYDASVEAVPSEFDEPGMYVPHGNKIQQILLLLDRPAFLVSGDVVGYGADGEPLLRDVEIITELTTLSGLGGFIPKKE